MKNSLVLLLSPLASRGLMLGEILGRRAGLTRLVLTLFRFFRLRPVFGSGFFPVMEKAGLVGVDMGSSIGLGLAERLAPGVLSGLSLGVLRADIRGVSVSSSRKAVSNLDSGGRSKEASGSARSSRIGGTPEGASKRGEGWMRISEAGVAGVVP
jgi:hypothetical protein